MSRLANGKRALSLLLCALVACSDDTGTSETDTLEPTLDENDGGVPEDLLDDLPDDLGSDGDTSGETIDPNRAPVADAGESQTVSKGETVELDGTASHDPDSDPLAFTWEQVSGTEVELSDSEISQPTFTAPGLGGELRFALTVSDGLLESEAHEVAVVVENVPPVANAGEGVDSQKRQEVTLDGSESADSDGDELSYSWHQSDGETVELEGATTAAPTFQTPGTSGVLTFELVVDDGEVLSEPDTVIVTITNEAPTAYAGAERAFASGEWVRLSGADSIDGDGDDLTYRWLQTDGPTVALSEADSMEASYRAPTSPTELAFRLIVSDGEVDSAPSAVTHTIWMYEGEAAFFGERADEPQGAGSMFRNRLAISAKQFVVVEGVAYTIGNRSESFHTIDVTGSGSPTLLDSLPLDSWGFHVRFQDNLVYLPSQDGLAVIDVEDPEDIEQVGMTETAKRLTGCVLFGDIAHCSQYLSKTVLLFSLTEPTEPESIGSYQTEGAPVAMEIEGDRLYITSLWGPTSYLDIFDVSDPSDPDLLGGVYEGLTRYRVAMAVHGGIAYLAGREIIDVVDARDIDGIALAPPVITANQHSDIEVSGDSQYLFLSTIEGVEVLDLADPLRPVHVAKYDGPKGHTAYEAGTLYVGGDGFWKLDVSDPISPVYPGLLVESTWSRGVYTEGSIAYLANSESVSIVDVSDPLQPSVLTTYEPPGGAVWDVATSPGMLAVAVGEAGVEFVDVSDPSTPDWVVTLDEGGDVRGVLIDGNRAYAIELAGVRVIDLSVPDEPESLALYEAPITGIFNPSLAVEGGFMYVVHGASFDIVELGTGEDPAWRATYPAWRNDSIHTLQVADGVAYIGVEEGLEIVDVRDPDAPEQISGISNEGVYAQTRFDGVVYCATGYAGISAVDVRNPDDPLFMGNYSTIDEAYHLAVREQTLVVAAGEHDEIGFLQTLDPFAVGRGRLAENYETGQVETTLAYHFENAEPELAVACTVTGGSCSVSVDEEAPELATIQWVLPAVPGHHELLVAVGEHRFLAIAGRDRVLVVDE